MTLSPKDRGMDSNAFSEKEFETLMFSYFDGCSDAATLQKLVCYLRDPSYIRRFVDLLRQDLIMRLSQGPTGKSEAFSSGGHESQESLNPVGSVVMQSNR